MRGYTDSVQILKICPERLTGAREVVVTYKYPCGDKQATTSLKPGKIDAENGLLYMALTQEQTAKMNNKYCKVQVNIWRQDGTRTATNEASFYSRQNLLAEVRE